MEDFISREKFLDMKRDYSPFLVHLTRDGLDEFGEVAVSAQEVLEYILDVKKLIACHHYCIFKDDIELLGENLQNKFKVVCFTETPIDLIEILLERVQGRSALFEPYGLVFKKDYIRDKGGNPVFYITGDLSAPLWNLFKDASANEFSKEEYKVLALINKCDEEIDFHWEREWRIVGNLEFKIADIYCGLSEEKYISYFEKKYDLKFIDPHWGINKILDKLVRK